MVASGHQSMQSMTRTPTRIPTAVVRLADTRAPAHPLTDDGASPDPTPGPEPSFPSVRIVPIVAVMVALWWAQDVVIPIVLSILISYGLEPLVTRLESRYAHSSRGRAAAPPDAHGYRRRRGVTSSEVRRSRLSMACLAPHTRWLRPSSARTEEAPAQSRRSSRRRASSSPPRARRP